MPNKKQMDKWIEKLIGMKEGGMSHEEIMQYIQDTTKVELFVYFMLDKDHNAVKIGMSQNPKMRFKSLQKSMLGELELLGYISCGEAVRDVERGLHRFFEQFHIKGEWFRYELLIKRTIEKFLEEEKKNRGATMFYLLEGKLLEHYLEHNTFLD